ncbi:unnamed protein product, partial [Nesidiocoris tenuis]
VRVRPSLPFLPGRQHVDGPGSEFHTFRIPDDQLPRSVPTAEEALRGNISAGTVTRRGLHGRTSDMDDEPAERLHPPPSGHKAVNSL